MSKRLSVIVVAAFVLLTLAGCSKPPEMEMAAANAAFDAARTAEAEQYAPDTYRVAMDSLNSANAMKTEQDAKFALFRSYGKSKELFVKAEAMAKQVAADAAAEKERVKAQVTEMMTQVRTALDAAKTAIDKAPKGKGSKADIEMFKNDLAAAEQGFTDAGADFNAGKYLVAKSKLEAVNQKAAKIQEDIALATAKKTGKK
jgi:hypothetical protein